MVCKNTSKSEFIYRSVDVYAKQAINKSFTCNKGELSVLATSIICSYKQWAQKIQQTPFPALVNKSHKVRMDFLLLDKIAKKIFGTKKKKEKKILS